MSDVIRKIVQFNQTIIGISQRSQSMLKEAEDDWLINALDEELREYFNADTLVDKVDALADLVYFAIGGLYRHGLTVTEIEEVFNAVHDCNMTKVQGIKATRGHDLDAVKPNGWLSPEERITKILGG